MSTIRASSEDIAAAYAKTPRERVGTRRIIWKCKCGLVRAYDYTSVRTLSHIDPVWLTPKWSEARLTRDADGVTRDVSHDYKCPCGRQRTGDAVKGSISTHKCGAKCTNSKSGVCECSCGGANHGKGWM